MRERFSKTKLQTPWKVGHPADLGGYPTDHFPLLTKISFLRDNLVKSKPLWNFFYPVFRVGGQPADPPTLMDWIFSLLAMLLMLCYFCSAVFPKGFRNSRAWTWLLSDFVSSVSRSIQVDHKPSPLSYYWNSL